MTQDKTYDYVVIGGGPAGYACAYRLKDLCDRDKRSVSIAIIEANDTLGGTCLNVGCIPSKALLHLSEVIHEAESVAQAGVTFAAPKIDREAILAWKDKIVKTLTQGLFGLAKRRRVDVIHGQAEFLDAHRLQVTGKDSGVITFKQAVIATGSRPVKLPFIPEGDERILDSTSALELPKIDGRLLVIGGGIIGCEMASFYRAFGSEVTVVEMTPEIMPGTDTDLAVPCRKMMESKGIKFLRETSVSAVKSTAKALEVSFSGENAPATQKYDLVLVSVGRVPNGHAIGADKAGIEVNDRGFIPVDKQLRTNVSHIYALGDIIGPPMLAHKASSEGHVAAEVIFGHRVNFDALCIPSVAYTDPEVAYVGVTETEAKAKGIKVKKGVFPWMASGRALCLQRREGLTKILVDENNQVIGGGIVGPSAGDMIGELALAIEMGCDIRDLALTIHPHPTLGETIQLAAEVIDGSITDL